MKKYVKLLTVFLALVMILQAAPLSAMGDSAQGDTYTSSEPVVENTQASATTEKNTVTMAAPKAAGIIESMVWKTPDDDVVHFVLSDGGKIEKNIVRIIVTLSEVFSDVTVSIDGVAVPSAVDGDQVAVDVEFLNGSHTMTVSVDNGIVVSTETVSFTVNGDAAYPALSIDTPKGISLGQTKTFTISCANMDQVENVAVRLLMTKQLKVKNVKIADGVTGSYVWFGGELELDLRVIDPAAITNGILVSFDVSAPVRMSADEKVYWSTESAEVTLKEDSTVGKSENFVPTFDTPDVSAPIVVQYTVSGWMYTVTNSLYGLLVKDVYGNPAVGVSIYEIVGKRDVLLGVTDEAGKLVVTFTNKGVHNVYAVGNDNLTSSLYSVKAYDAVGDEYGAPYAIRYVGYVNNGKNISWMSNYNATKGAAQIKVSTSEDMADAVVYKGVSNYALYESSLTINRVNEVTLQNLVPGTVYYYQVGDGRIWSEVHAFEAKTYGDEVNIAIMGDLRGEYADNVELIANSIMFSCENYDFAIRTGAVTDGVLDSNALIAPTAPFFNMGLDLVHTSSDAEFASSIQNRVFFTKEKLQSYLCGDVYIAVINATANVSELRNLINTVRTESTKNGSKWQILSIRDAVYSTDPEASTVLRDVLPELVELAGIDLVISGSDCNFSRTEPLRQGQVSEKNGVIYMNCGSTSVKKPVVNGEGFAVTSDSYNALYISLSATDKKLSVTVYDVQPDGTRTEVDSFVREYSICAEEDHQYVYGPNTYNLMACSVCGYTRTQRDYVGLMGVGSYHMFYDRGRFLKGWQTHNGKTYFLNRNTCVALDGTQEIDGYTYVFENYVLVEGAWVEEDGARKLMWAGELLTNTWHTQAGVTYYFLNDGTMATGTVEISSVNDQGETVVETYVFDENGALMGKQE